MVPRKTFYIGTKVGRYKPNIGEMFDFSAEKVIRSVDESLARLRLPFVDIIQVEYIRKWTSSLLHPLTKSVRT